MYCCKCGAKIYLDARHCHNCGSFLPPSVGETSLQRSTSHELLRPRNESINEEQRSLVKELLTTDRKEHECHKCGAREKLSSWGFGLGRVISSKHTWSETAASAAISAITLPLIGFGALRLPGKKTNLSVLRLRLVLCEFCRKEGATYSVHPWWNGAQRLGYTEFLCPTDLNELRSVR